MKNSTQLQIDWKAEDSKESISLDSLSTVEIAKREGWQEQKVRENGKYTDETEKVKKPKAPYFKPEIWTHPAPVAVKTRLAELTKKKVNQKTNKKSFWKRIFKK